MHVEPGREASLSLLFSPASPPVSLLSATEQMALCLSGLGHSAASAGKELQRPRLRFPAQTVRTHSTQPTFTVTALIPTSKNVYFWAFSQA